MPERPSFAFVVLHHMAADATRACVSALLALPMDGCGRHVIIVDNGSKDGSGKLLEWEFENNDEVTVLLSGENLGLARGFNLGCAWALEHLSPGFVTTLHSDVLVEDPGFVPWVLSQWDSAPFGVLGPDVVGARDGEHQSPKHMQIPTFEALCDLLDEDRRNGGSSVGAYARKMVGRLADGVRSLVDHDAKSDAAPRKRSTRHERPHDNVVLSSALLVFSRAFFETRPHAFNPATFLFYEDEILAYECMRDGIPLRYSPAYTVSHMGEVSLSASLPARYRREQTTARELARSRKVLCDLMMVDARATRFKGELHVNEALVSAAHIDYAWAGNPINASARSHGSLVSHYASGSRTQFFAWYASSGEVVLARRQGDGPWEMRPTGIYLDQRDARNAISLVVDGSGVLHVFVCSHNHPIVYARSAGPLALELQVIEVAHIAGSNVSRVWAERQASGDLVLVRGEGDKGQSLLVNRYLVREGVWTSPVELLRNVAPSWQAALDTAGRLHVVWQWDGAGQEASDDLCYVASTDAACDGFATSDGHGLDLPVARTQADVICQMTIGPGSPGTFALCVHRSGSPRVLVGRMGECDGRWLLYLPNALGWFSRTVIIPLKAPKAGPFPRPQAQPLLLARDDELFMVLRDDAEDAKARVVCIRHGVPSLVCDVTTSSVGAWEPTYDVNRWRREGVLEMPVQHVLFSPNNRNVLQVETPIFIVSANVENMGSDLRRI